MKLRIKYFDNAKELQKIAKGNWIDVYANKDIFIPVGKSAMIPLGFALELPEGWEGHLLPRSSTFKVWGIIMTNGKGIVDDTFKGDNDQWHMPVYCLEPRNYMTMAGDILTVEGAKQSNMLGLRAGTYIKKGDKIGQFRIMEVMPDIEFEKVESFGNLDRGGFGSTGTN